MSSSTTTVSCDVTGAVVPSVAVTFKSNETISSTELVG